MSKFKIISGIPTSSDREELKKLSYYEIIEGNEDIKTFTEGHYWQRISWITLKDDNEIEPHTHNYKSVLFINNGQGQITGDITSTFQEKTLILIPENCRHGFKSINQQGFTAMSINLCE